MRRAVARVAAAAAAALLLAATPGPASAGSEEWQRIPCASGAIDEATVSPDGTYLTLEWHLDCVATPDVPRATYGHGLYGDKDLAIAPGQGMRGYAKTAPTLHWGTARLPGDDVAICVVTDYDVRVDCVRMARDARGQVVAQPLPTDDPMVDRPVRYIPFEQGGGGTCGGCW